MPFGPLSLLPSSVLGIAREIGRHILRRPVVGLAVAARTGHDDGRRWLLIRRGDTGTWALPGGTVEWGETLRSTFDRELLEEAGVTGAVFERVTGVYSRPDRDPRFHAVTVVVRATIPPPPYVAPMNPLEIREARLFREDELPAPLAMQMDDLFAAARRDGPVELE
jgi:8-oxo-dGTP diphosphatase